MFNLGDLFRSILCIADEIFIEMFGRPLSYYQLTSKDENSLYIEDSDRTWDSSPIHLRGIYKIPDDTIHHFGMDIPAEMRIELSSNWTMKKLAT